MKRQANTNRIQLDSILNDPVTVVGRTFAIVIQLLIVASLLGFSIETLPDLTAETRGWLRWLEVITVVIFSAEYLLRLWAAENRWKFATSFFGIIDLLAVLPFYIAPGADLRSVRVFRLLRLFRLLKLVRYSNAARRFHVALNIAREELILFGTVSVIMLYLSAVGIYFFEHEAQPTHFASVFHSLWWATTTLTTVGYGDVYPITLGGRCFTFVVLLIGLGIISIPAGIVASALAKAREIEDK
ncbi:MAG: voltage-gated potassium channel [Planctomycetaceae bacterium TMED240]|nr:voltage-gated potassium channel [Rhodopirellula sp.]OUX06947.1 MAG: voltage-gated potassium channel [Planctomycetaceae bacterium TMED240]